MTSSLHPPSRSNRLCRTSFSLTLAFLCLILGTFAPRVEAQVVVRGPYLQSGTPSSIIVRWRTDVPTDSLVRFGTTQGSLSQTAPGSSSTTEHVVSIGGLAADTKYFYSVGTLSAELAGNDNEHFFVTSPGGGNPKPTRIWVVGDSGTANAAAMAVRNAFLDFTGNRTPDLWLMLGDNAYSDGTDAQYQAAVFDMYPGILRHTVLWPTLGNHDGHTASSASQSGPYYDIFTLPTNGSAGGLPSGTEAYYSFDYGNIHVVCLNSTDVDRSPSGSMLTWLTMDLQNNDKPWVIAFWHHPPYSKGSHDSDSSGALTDMRVNALPILEEYGVDLVLAGHSHSYERSYLIDSHYGTSDTFTDAMKKDPGDGSELGDGAYQKPFLPGASHEGAVYAVAGSSGKTSGGSLDHPVMVVSLNSLGSMVLDIDDTRLDAKFLDENKPANVLDDFTILKGPDTSGDTESPTPPGGLTVTSVSTTEVGLTWTASTDNIGVVEYRIYKDGLETGIATGTSFTVTALAPNTSYDFWVTARDLAGNESGASNTVAVTTDPDTEPPTAPGTPTLVATSDTAVTITWSWATDNVGVVAYDVYRDGAQVGSTTQTENTFTDTGLTASTTYGYSLTARDAAGNISIQSATLTVTTDPGPDTEAPTAPGTPTLVSKDDTTVTLAWGLATDNVGVVAYDVYRDGVAVGSTTEPDNTYTDTGLSPETTYGYSVTARDAAGNVSAFSGTLTVTTDASPQLSVHVSGITLTLRSFGQWYAARAVVTVADGSGSPVDGATVAVQWSGLTGESASAVTTGGSVSFDSNKVPNSSTGQFVLTVTGVSAPGYIYDFSANVQSAACVDTTGNSCSVGPPPPPDTAPPAAPTSLVATAGAGSVALDWDDNTTDADWASFSVYRSTTAGSGHVLIAEGVTTSQYTDAGLSGGTTYYYFITAKDTSSNESAPSNEASATPADPPQLSVHVTAVAVALLQQGKNYTGVASVTVVDQNSNPVAGVSVEGTWTLSGTPIGSSSGTTDASGMASVDSSKQKPLTGQIFEFTVTNLIGNGYSYDAASNTINSASATVP